MPHSEVRFSRPAVADLEALIDWIDAAAGSAIAHAYVELIRARCELLARFPRRGSMRRTRPEVRSIPFRRSATILYRVDPDGVLILRVLHRGRDVEQDLATLT